MLDVFAALDDEVKELMSIDLDALILNTDNPKQAKALLELMEALRDHLVITTTLRRGEFEEVEQILAERGYEIHYLNEGKKS